MAVAHQPDDSAVALQALAPLLRCSGYITSVAEALANLGTGGRKALLAYVRGDEHTIRDRLDVAYALQKGNGPIDSEHASAADHRDRGPGGAMRP